MGHSKGMPIDCKKYMTVAHMFITQINSKLQQSSRYTDAVNVKIAKLKQALPFFNNASGTMDHHKPVTILTCNTESTDVASL